MGRPVMLGNGSLTVGLNEHGLVHDFYYPYVGLENLTTSRSVHHLIGVWVDGTFSWVDDGTWEIAVDFETDALVSTVSMKHPQLQVELQFQDFVDHKQNAFCRKGTVYNHSNEEKEIRIFLHQVFQISRAGRADTALYVPEDNYLLDYKGRCSLLIYGQFTGGESFDQFAIGNYGIEGKEGTFKDSEDGELSGHPVEHGGVDSVMRLATKVAAASQREFEYWIVAADSQFAAERVHHYLLKEGLQHRLEGNRRYWHEWLAIGANQLHGIDKAHLDSTKKSLMVIKAHIDRRGGIIASCDSSIYNYGRDYYSYVWPRDGAYVLWPLIRMGYTEEPRRFFEFCRDIMTHKGYLMHKYQPDRAIGSTWHPLLHGLRTELAIQEDETAVVLYMLGEYHQYTQDDEFIHSLYTTFIKPAAHFLSDFIDEQTGLPHASYDLWEEKFLTTTYTSAVVYQALLVAAEFAERYAFPEDALTWSDAAERILKNAAIFYDEDRGAYRKGFLLQEDGSLVFDNTLDVSSFYGVMMFGLHESTEGISRTAHAIESTLLDQSPAGGTPRYEHDHYFESNPPFMGNPWFVTTLWMAQYYVRCNQIEKAWKYVDWSISHALPSGVFSEQINPTDGSPTSVAPLVWSHAEFINTVLDISNWNNQQR